MILDKIQNKYKHLVVGQWGIYDQSLKWIFSILKVPWN